MFATSIDRGLSAGFGGLHKMFKLDMLPEQPIKLQTLATRAVTYREVDREEAGVL